MPRYLITESIAYRFTLIDAENEEKALDLEGSIVDTKLDTEQTYDESGDPIPGGYQIVEGIEVSEEIETVDSFQKTAPWKVQSNPEFSGRLLSLGSDVEEAKRRYRELRMGED